MDEFLHLLTNPAHWVFEVVTDLAKFALIWIVGSLIPDQWNPVKRWVARHDREKHGTDRPNGRGTIIEMCNGCKFPSPDGRCSLQDTDECFGPTFHGSHYKVFYDV